MGCSKRNYYEKPIKEWLYKNLNDFKSYEPIEFVVVSDLKPFLNIYEQYAMAVSEKISEANILLITIQDYESFDKLLVNKLSETLDALPQNYSLDKDFSPIQTDSILKILDETISLLEEMQPDGYFPDLIIGFDFYNSSKKDYNRTLKEFSYQLNELGASLKTFNSYVKNGQVIIHRYRANNALGALVIGSRLFVIDENLQTVIGTKALN